LNKKGQGIAIDLMAGVLIFIIIGSSIMFVWGDKSFEVEENLFENERIAMAERTLNTIVISKGLPTDWEKYIGTEEEIANNIKMLGLARRDRVLDKKKVEKFAELSNFEDNYAILKTKLLIGGNEYYFRILDPKRENVDEQIISAGESPTGNVVEIRIERAVIYSYHRDGVDEGDTNSQHEAIAELILYSSYWRR